MDLPGAGGGLPEPFALGPGTASPPRSALTSSSNLATTAAGRQALTATRAIDR
ncbi:hypothetical protein [Nonomuraea basaltis]|uniref:hypothetical protein n=1 Tax=Nonomuraea basaltis TaxID=2495887 RepID=UPI001486F6A9|nr:hypothetical protein [Nonomuraea basaltis]